MLDQQSLNTYQKHFRGITQQVPDFHLVLGSGFGQVLQEIEHSEGGWQKLGEIGFQQIPGLNPSTVPDHAGKYIFLESKKLNLLIQVQMGRLHGYEGNSPQQVVQTVMLPRLMGVKNFILTNAAGGLLSGMNPGSVMIIDDHLNFTGQNPLIGENPKDPSGQELGPRFIDMSDTYKETWRDVLAVKLKAQKLRLHNGVYLGLLGPNFETAAEIKIFGKWGVGAVGMSTVWETLALKHSGAQIAGVSLISNLAAGLSLEKLDHLQILETCRKSASQIMTGILQSLPELKVLA